MDESLNGGRRTGNNRAWALRPAAEALEGRRLLTATIRVNTFEDMFNPPPGTVSLRSAISTANTDGKADTIIVPAGTYEVVRNLRIVPNGRLKIESEGGLATINEVLNATPGNLPVNNTVFTVARGANATFVDLAITGGVANEMFTSMQGGGLINRGHTTLLGCTLFGNSAINGGGLDNQGELTIQHSTITTNTSTDSGAGIANDGVLTIRDSSISGNTSEGAAGGIFNTKTLRLFDTRIQSNTSRRFGGGLWNLVGRSTIERSRISGNTPNDMLTTNGGSADIGTSTFIGGPGIG